MATDTHLCPSGLKSKSLLRRRGYALDDRPLTSRAEQDAFKAEYGVSTTPQAFIDGERVGGYEDLKRRLGYRVREKGETTYAPVIAIFSVTALMALAAQWQLAPDAGPLADPLASAASWLKWFVAFSMCALAIQKLTDVGGFVNGFLGYDLLARAWVPYGYFYPFAEAWVGIGMIALIGTGSTLIWLVAPVGIVIGAIGAISVVKAVYVDRRELTCACVGGGSNVPLGGISLTENLMMLAMGVWMLATLA
ncbi:MAG: MauE/DoxX family redox-associated membrane protein [Paracoccaceae bacterium]